LFEASADLLTENYWLFGQPFYRTFDIVHDMDGKQMAFKSSGTNSLVVQGAANSAKYIAFGLTIVSVIATFL